MSDTRRPTDASSSTIKRLFDRVSDLPEAEQRAFLDTECGDEPDVRSTLERMLADRPGTGDVTRSIGDVVRSVTSPHPAAGSSIAHYRLTRLLGEGGMGEVWLAEQSEPVRRNVALKLIRPGMDSRQFLARFESERQALAMMSHPHIARVFDAGATDRGAPYFAMEYVEGKPIDRFCDSGRMGIKQRLMLFLDVCNAVQHAHQRGIIHRDLKPSNVLVQESDGAAECKIIDFGISKMTEPSITGAQMMTAVGQRVGTPSFMSPEQAAGLRDIDTRTDVYSLGVLLYDQLTGTTPLDREGIEAEGFADISERIVHEEAPQPSRRLVSMGSRANDVAARRGTDVERLARRLRGDLDWIALRALEKDRDRRYASPAELAADIRRHLANEPVSAGPPTIGYRLGKFVRRHTLAVVAAGLIVVAIVVGGALATYGLVRAQDAESVAVTEATAAQEVSDFLVRLFQMPDPSQARGNEVSAREILDRGAIRIASTLGDRPELQVRMMSTIADTYGGLGLYDEAARLQHDALAILQERFGNDHPETLALRVKIGELKIVTGDGEEAEKFLVATVEDLRRVHGPDALETLKAELLLAEAISELTRYQDAVDMLEDVLARRQRVLGGADVETYRNMVTLGMGLAALPDYDRGVPMYERGFQGQKQLLGNDHPTTLESMNGLILLYRTVERYEDAEVLGLEALELIPTIVGDDHALLGTTMINVADLYNAQRRFEESEELYVDGLAILRGSVGNEHPDTMLAVNNLGFMHTRAKQNEKAEPLLREAYETQLRVIGPDHANTLMAKINLGDLCTTLGKLDESEELLRAAVDDARRILPEENVLTAVTLHHYGRSLTALGRHSEAENYLLESYDMMVATSGADSQFFTVRAVRLLVELYEAWDRPDRVAEWRELLPDE